MAEVRPGGAERSAAAVIGAALVVVGLVHYRGRRSRGEVYWLVLGVAVLAAAAIVHVWLVRAQRRELA